MSTKICVFCGKSFNAQRSTQRFCNSICREGHHFRARNAERPKGLPPERKKTPGEIQWELVKSIQRATTEGMEELVWNKVKDRLIPFWLELLESLEPDEREHLIWAVHNNVDKIDNEKA